MSGKFYLGRRFDPLTNSTGGEPLQYDPDDLTTHGVVVGMTGSGKTGLCIAIMEEAALQGIPAILIDPKGDLTNLLLHFPDLAPADFQPWMDPELARRAGKTMEQAAEDAARAWQQGLAEWDIDRARLAALRDAAQYAVYTPGSDAGIPVSVLSSLAAPGLEWAGNREILLERISSTVTALLGLVGLTDIDPLRSREHILLANIFQNAWSRNQSLDINELMLQIQSPPFEKLGAFAVDTFFPAKERTALALQLNNIMAAPSFELWRVGQPLDIAALLQPGAGRPRHSVFYLAHLSESERMFFVTLLFSALETWMRTQAGATSLRALVYMDEIFGYLPPTSIPPSKPPLLRMLKQARAFGLGLLLATQNPVDIDYKALSNAGTWFIGKLQTERDKLRLLDGLESAAAGTLDRSTLDRMISGLGKRVFIMNNIHSREPLLFQTRWAMNYLAGPMTRVQIPALNRMAGATWETPPPAVEQVPPPAEGMGLAAEAAQAAVPQGFDPLPMPAGNSAGETTLTQPTVPQEIAEFFLPLNLSFARALEKAGQGSGAVQTGLLYRPALIASAQVRFLDRRYGLDTEVVRSCLVTAPNRRGGQHWESFVSALPDAADMDSAPAAQARFASLDAPLAEARQMTALQRDFASWVHRESRVVIRANQTLGVFATPDVGQAEFMKACEEARQQALEEDLRKSTAAVERQMRSLEEKIRREERELGLDEEELAQRRGEEIATHTENVLSVFSRRRGYRRLSSSLTKHRMTAQAKEEVSESLAALDAYDAEMERLEQEQQQIIAAARQRWEHAASEVTQIPLLPKKTDIHVAMFGIGWLPYYLAQGAQGTFEVPAFEL